MFSKWDTMKENDYFEKRIKCVFKGCNGYLSYDPNTKYLSIFENKLKFDNNKLELLSNPTRHSNQPIEGEDLYTLQLKETNDGKLIFKDNLFPEVTPKSDGKTNEARLSLFNPWRRFLYYRIIKPPGLNLKVLYKDLYFLEHGKDIDIYCNDHFIFKF